MRPNSRKLKALTDMPLPKSKKDLHAFFCILDYMRNFPHFQLRYVSIKMTDISEDRMGIDL